MKIKKVMALTMASAMVISMALSGCGSDGGSNKRKQYPRGRRQERSYGSYLLDTEHKAECSGSHCGGVQQTK